MSTTSQNNQPRRTLLLTGASRGIGHATVMQFAMAGWRILRFTPDMLECQPHVVIAMIRTALQDLGTR